MPPIDQPVYGQHDQDNKQGDPKIVFPSEPWEEVQDDQHCGWDHTEHAKRPGKWFYEIEYAADQRKYESTEMKSIKIYLFKTSFVLVPVWPGANKRIQPRQRVIKTLAHK